MATPVQIPAGESLYIHGLHSKPDGDPPEGQDKILVIMVHGFPGNKESHGNVFANLDHILSDKHYHTLRFDFRGCGASDGQAEDFTTDSAMQDFLNVLVWAKNQGYEHFMFICEGLGATIALMNAPEQALCYVLLWPVLDPPLVAKNIFKAGQIEDEWKKTGYVLIGEDRVGIPFIEQLEKIEITDAIGDLNKPVLIMHGAADETSPISQLDIARANAGTRRMEITSFQDGTHGLPQPNHRRSMFFHIAQFMEKYS
ncbi:MAG: alpha/beta fold hydrolase [Alphaproteobacteria bacterium]